MNPLTDEVAVREIEEAEEEEQVSIRLINVIFLPFHPAVQIVTLCAVITKSLLGPFAGTYPRILCASEAETTTALYYFLRFYEIVCDPIIAINFFLHIIHRQVTEEASKREYPPKSLMALFLDILSLIPFFSLIAKEACPPTKLWPNIMGFIEILCFYRVIEYFDLKDTHSVTNLLIGYTIILIFLMNLMASLIVLLTYHGLCSACAENIYDWRLYFIQQYEPMNRDYNLYSFTIPIAAKNLFFLDLIEFRPATYLEYTLFCIPITMGFLSINFLFGPKILAEIMSRARKRTIFHARAKRIIGEAKKRNPSSDGNFDLENYFSVVWKKMGGVTVPPELLNEIPRYMKLHMKEDTAWAVFHHSPTLRRTSSSYKRWLYDQMSMEYRMPGERLFSGRHCYTYLYYLKAGIVQLLSSDDGATPVLSVTGGSIFGDVSFYLPPLHRQTQVRCLTYCEIIVIPRAKLLYSMLKFPEDRSMILKSVSERIKHAKILNTCKTGIRGLDRTEDEGLAWLKTRWWTLWTTIQNWKKSSKKDTQKCKLPAEKSSYRCSKYIGQLVLCTRDQMQLSKLFANVSFPWILSENSSFTIIWHKIVKVVVLMVLVLFPPNIVKEQTPDWFDFLCVVVNIIYAVDLFFIVITKTEKQRNDVDFKAVVVAKFKSWRFLLDVLATVWLRQLCALLGQDSLASVAPMAHLLKLHVFFDPEFYAWKSNTNLFNGAIRDHLFFSFSTLYIFAHLLFMLVPLLGGDLIVDTEILFGPLVCTKLTNKKCKSSKTWIFYYYIFEYYLGVLRPKSYLEAIIHLVNSSTFYFLAFYGQYKILAALLLHYQHINNYNVMVTTLRLFYIKFNLHPDALKRLERYLLCQWKSNHGMCLMHPNATEGESDSACWAHHGRAAERIIGASKLFANSHSSLIKDIAEKSRFSLVPQGSTLILFGVQCDCITWIVEGELKCEYKNDDDDIVTHYIKPMDVLTLSPLFPGLPALKTYATATDCEILYITKKDFLKVMNQHPEEWSRINAHVEELTAIFDDTFRQLLKRHQSYQKKLRERIFHDRKSIFVVTVKQKIDDEEIAPTSVPFGTFISSPETPFVCFWITTRMLVVLLSIFSVNMLWFYMHYGVIYHRTLFGIQSFCDFVGFADIVLKLFLPYLDGRGLIVSDYQKCMKYYLSRGFILDLIGTVPWKYFLLLLNDGRAVFDVANECEIYTKYAHLYLISGYFNYIVDKPCKYRNHLLFIKWQIIILLVMLAAGNFFFHRCFEFKFSGLLYFVSSTVKRGNTCWKPFNTKIAVNHTHSSYPFRIARCVETAQGLIFGVYRSENDVFFHGTAITWLVGLTLKFVFWFVFLYCQMLVVLNTQTNTWFQHAFHELIDFLKEERVEKPIIKRCMVHYNYVWLRSKGVNTEKLYKDIGPGIGLSQDIKFYLFKRIYEGLNTFFKGDETLAKNLSGVVSNRRFSPNEDIMREMDLVPFVYIVRRGQVNVFRRERKLAIITTGGLFGQLSGTQPRPVRVTVRTDNYTDVLELSIEDFQNIFSQENQEILNKNRYDYIKLKDGVNVAPSLIVENIIRGIRILKIPYIMSNPVYIRSCVWYERFLYFAWMWLPSAIVYIVAFALVRVTRPVIKDYLFIAHCILDMLFLVYYVTELFTMELVVHHNKIECRYFKWRLLFKWSFILNTISLFVPLGYIFIDDSQIINLTVLLKFFRTHVYIYFYRHFCNNFQNKYSSIIFKLVTLFNVIHCSACIWIYVTCNAQSALLTQSRHSYLKYAPNFVNNSIDWNEWSLGKFSVGCLRNTQAFETPQGRKAGIAISNHWYGDYLMSFWYILTVLTKTEADAFKKYGPARILRMVLLFIIQWTRYWISAAAISLFFTNFSEMYSFERRIEALKTYFKCKGLSNGLLQAMDNYAKQLWKRQKGSSLPKFAKEAPRYLKQDIFSSLYMHHLRTPTLFQVFPEYFLRQLVVRLKRKVVFPGNYIVQEGDVHPTLYFIHEGEVEKWCIDAKGESKMSCVLTMNAYFGLVPALFPNAHYQYAYYSRTVVDLICLDYSEWQDLLNAYPDIKTNLYRNAQKYRHGDKHGKSNKLDAQTVNGRTY